jgi:antitoxin VapB
MSDSKAVPGCRNDCKPGLLRQALSLEDKETDRLAREVAALTGETLTDAIRKALAERLARERLRRGVSLRLVDRLMEIGRHCAALPDLDRRSPDEIVGYDETGMWRTEWSSTPRRSSPFRSASPTPSVTRALSTASRSG